MEFIIFCYAHNLQCISSNHFPIRPITLSWETKRFAPLEDSNLSPLVSIIARETLSPLLKADCIEFASLIPSSALCPYAAVAPLSGKTTPILTSAALKLKLRILAKIKLFSFSTFILVIMDL